MGRRSCDLGQGLPGIVSALWVEGRSVGYDRGGGTDPNFGYPLENGPRELLLSLEKGGMSLTCH